MTVFVDTSACYAFTSATDVRHVAARATFLELIERNERLVTTSYALAETMGLIQRRLGWEPLERFGATAETFDVIWIDARWHRTATDLLFRRRQRQINLVDAASFAVMRELGIETAFAFDDDFEREGFRVLGAGM